MARLIVKSPYIKCGGGNSAGGYMRYIATRERVELIQNDRPPTRKQEQLIAKLVKDFPDTPPRPTLRRSSLRRWRKTGAMFRNRMAT